MLTIKENIMALDEEFYETINILDTKERLLNEIIVWLRSKGLWEECQKDLVTKVVPSKEKQ